MKILQVSAFDVGGGAARIAMSLQREFRRRGHTARLAVGHKIDPTSDTFQLPRENSRATRLRRAWDRYWGLETYQYPGSRALLGHLPEMPGVVHLHNLHGEYFDLRLLGKLADRVPTLLTLHDQWLFTGHCAHGMGCERWRIGCGHCPDLAIYPAVRRDLTAINWSRKRAVVRGKRLFIATPSAWLGDSVAQSLLSEARLDLRVIPNGVDTTVFSPGDRAAARDALGIPRDARVLFFAAQGAVNNPFKDFESARAAVQRLGRGAILLVAGAEGPREDRGSYVFWPAGSHVEEGSLRTLYQASDCLIHAALAETFPTVILEAMGCGIPVVATAIGGIPEQVTEGETGYLVPLRDPVALAQAAEKAIADSARLGAAGRKKCETNFSMELQVTRTLDWYDQAVKDRR